MKHRKLTQGENYRARRERLIAEGKCIKCGKVPPDGPLLCDGCRERQRQACRDYAARKKAEKAGGTVEGPHGYDKLIQPRDGSHDAGALRPY